MDLKKSFGLCCGRNKITKELPNPIHIIVGLARKALKGTILANHEIELMSKLRLDICRACVTKGKNTLDEEGWCNACGCDMEAKSRVPAAHCELSKW